MSGSIFVVDMTGTCLKKTLQVIAWKSASYVTKTYQFGTWEERQETDRSVQKESPEPAKSYPVDQQHPLLQERLQNLITFPLHEEEREEFEMRDSRKKREKELTEYASHTPFCTRKQMHE